MLMRSNHTQIIINHTNRLVIKKVKKLELVIVKNDDTIMTMQQSTES